MGPGDVPAARADEEKTVTFGRILMLGPDLVPYCWWTADADWITPLFEKEKIMADLKAVADLADRITARNLKNTEAFLGIYDVAEKAAFVEGAIFGAFTAGRLKGMMESAGIQADAEAKK